MSSTYTFDKLVLVHAGPAATTYFLLEQSYPSNTWPQRKRWDVLWCGSYERCFSKVLEWSYYAGGNGIRDVAKTSAGYIARWREAFAKPRALVTPTLRAAKGSEPNALSRINVESIREALAAAGATLSERELVLSIDNPAQLALLEEHQRGQLSLSTFMRPPVDFVGAKIPVPPQVCAEKQLLRQFPYAVEVHAVPDTELGGEFYIVSDDQGSQLTSSVHNWMTRTLIACEFSMPGTAEDACRLLTKMVTSANKEPRLPSALSQDAALVNRKGFLSDWQHECFEALASTLGQATGSDCLEVPLRAASTPSVARYLKHLTPAALVANSRALAQASLF